MPPRVVELANQFRDDLLATEDGQRAIMAQRWLDIESAIERHIDKLIEDAYAQLIIGEPPSESRIFEMNRYQALQQQTTRLIQQYIADIDSPLNKIAADIVVRGVENAVILTKASAAEFGGSVRVTLMQLNTAAVEQVIALARAEQPLADLMVRAYGEAADGMLTELINGIALGRNPRDTARRMLQDGLSRGFNHTELVARDQFNRAYREASRQQYAHSNVVEAYVRLAAKNDRTCLACLALDGRVYNTDQVMELHPQDRCTHVPKVKGFPPVQFQTGQQWFDSLTADDQRRIMGPTRYDAYQSGKFNFGEMAMVKENDIWGPSAQITPVHQLIG